jgi:hypothetical protein
VLFRSRGYVIQFEERGAPGDNPQTKKKSHQFHYFLGFIKTERALHQHDLMAGCHFAQHPELYAEESTGTLFSHVEDVLRPVVGLGMPVGIRHEATAQPLTSNSFVRLSWHSRKGDKPLLNKARAGSADRAEKEEDRLRRNLNSYFGGRDRGEAVDKLAKMLEKYGLTVTETSGGLRSPQTPQTPIARPLASPYTPQMPSPLHPMHSPNHPMSPHNPVSPPCLPMQMQHPHPMSPQTACVLPAAAPAGPPPPTADEDATMWNNEVVVDESEFEKFLGHN